MADARTMEADLIHQFKNHLSIIVGFCDLLLSEVSDGDAHKPDLIEIQKAAYAAMALVPELSKRFK